MCLRETQPREHLPVEMLLIGDPVDDWEHTRGGGTGLSVSGRGHIMSDTTSGLTSNKYISQVVTGGGRVREMGWGDQACQSREGSASLVSCWTIILSKNVERF